MRIIITSRVINTAFNSLDCLKCNGATSCSPVSTTCSSSETCLTISSITDGFEHLGFTRNGFVKKCGPKLQTCGQLLSAKFAYAFKFDARVECCETNQCNTGVYNVTPAGQAWQMPVGLGSDLQKKE
ncbi:UNVERIFIED_CONTAM: hypothetical protein FKN15_060927 [Acipenser sinensis]